MGGKHQWRGVAPEPPAGEAVSPQHPHRTWGADGRQKGRRIWRREGLTPQGRGCRLGSGADGQGEAWGWGGGRMLWLPFSWALWPR